MCSRVVLSMGLQLRLLSRTGLHSTSVSGRAVLQLGVYSSIRCPDHEQKLSSGVWHSRTCAPSARGLAVCWCECMGVPAGQHVPAVHSSALVVNRKASGGSLGLYGLPVVDITGLRSVVLAGLCVVLLAVGMAALLCLLTCGVHSVTGPQQRHVVGCDVWCWWRSA